MTAEELDSDTSVEGVIASVKPVPLPAGSTTCVEKLSAPLWELMSNNKKNEKNVREDVGADEPTLAHGPPVADLCSAR